ncbi:MAG: LysR family transcriptional regulator [Deltaproteobacteria bacterium]|nr:LysR family transcriptional regulator [Deltaproteobacteria bacterium]
MTLHQLKIWTIVARRQSMTKAADELRIRQPSVTQQVKLLEKEYRLKLYEVNGRGIELTQAGKLFLKNANRILLQVQNFEKSLKGLKRSRRHR